MSRLAADTLRFWNDEDDVGIVFGACLEDDSWDVVTGQLFTYVMRHHTHTKHGVVFRYHKTHREEKRNFV